MFTNTKIRRSLAVLAASAAFAGAHSAQAGPLDPPAGPVAPTQATVIDAVPFTITEPGSYVLTGDLDLDFDFGNTAGIEILVSDVTIDFQGFTLKDSFNNTVGFGIGFRNDVENITIRNGSIRGFATFGIRGLFASNVRVENMRVYENDGQGILLRELGTVINSTASGNGSNGIAVGPGSMVMGCRADGNGATGIEGNRFDDASLNGFLIKDSIALNNVGPGIVLQSSGGARVGLIENCVTTGNGAQGILVTDSLVRGCFSSGNTGADISAGGASAVIDSLP